jgi:hypothetical protein
VYEYEKYLITFTELDRNISVSVQPIGDIIYQPHITYINNDAVIDFSNVVIKPDHCEELIHNIESACKVIEEIRKHIKEKRS